LCDQQFDQDVSIVQVIAAEGEQKASRALRQAADVIAESSSALQVLYTYSVEQGTRALRQAADVIAESSSALQVLYIRSWALGQAVVVKAQSFSIGYSEFLNWRCIM
jgi:hypothetical protein